MHLVGTTPKHRILFSNFTFFFSKFISSQIRHNKRYFMHLYGSSKKFYLNPPSSSSIPQHNVEGLLFSWQWPCLSSLLDSLFLTPLGKRPFFVSRTFRQYLKTIKNSSFTTNIWKPFRTYLFLRCWSKVCCGGVLMVSSLLQRNIID